MTVKHPRPWYAPRPIVNAYCRTLNNGGDLKMLKALKILRSIIVNAGILAISLYAVSEGGDATVIGTVALLVLGGYNGLEFSDYAALLQAYKEVQDEQ